MARLLAIASAVLWLLALPANASVGDLDVASSPGHAWVALSVEGEQRPFQRLYHLPADGSPQLGYTTPALTLPSNAKLLCAVENRLLFILEPDGLQDPTQPIYTRVRETAARRIEGPRPYAYDEPRAVAHIPERHDVLAATGFDGAAWIIVGETDIDATLYTLDRGEWREVADLGRAPDERLSLLPLGTTLSLLRTQGAQASLWSIDAETGATQRTAIFDAQTSGRCVGIAGRVVAIATSDTGDALSVLVDNQSPRSIAPVPNGAMPFNAGGNAGAVWVSEGGTLTAHIVSLSGIDLFSGTLTPRAIIRPEEFQVLGLVLVSALLTMIFFIWRPFEKSAAVNFPSGFALAEPSRRATAWGVDLVVSALASAAIWRVGLGEVLLLGPVGSLGIIPTITAITIFIAHTTLAETLTGRSLGKALVRVRVIDSTGGAPGFGRALLRNFVRGFCPTLGFALLMGPVVREPWACGTWVIMPVGDGESGARRGEQPSQSDRDPGSD